MGTKPEIHAIRTKEGWKINPWVFVLVRMWRARKRYMCSVFDVLGGVFSYILVTWRRVLVNIGFNLAAKVVFVGI